MNTKMVTLTGGPQQVLTGSYHIARISAIGTDGGSVALYDAVTDKTDSLDQALLINTTQSGVRQIIDQKDCNGIGHDYNYPGVVAGTPLSVGPVLTLIPSAIAINGVVAQDVDIVTTRGLWADAPSAGATVNLTVEYFPNLSRAN